MKQELANRSSSILPKANMAMLMSNVLVHPQMGNFSYNEKYLNSKVFSFFSPGEFPSFLPEQYLDSRRL